MRKLILFFCVLTLSLCVILGCKNSAGNSEKQENGKTFSPGKDYTVGANYSSFAMKQKTFGDDPKDPNYVIVFEDDFNKKFNNSIQTHDGTGSKFAHNESPDPTKWDVITDFRDNGWYKAEQVKIDDTKGRLVITAESKNGQLNKRPNEKPESYSRVTGRIQSKQKFGFLYGKVYTKFKLPKAATWPAIWFLANSEKSKDEIDMIEYYPHNNPNDWQTVFHNGTDWGSGNWGAGNNLQNYENRYVYGNDINDEDYSNPKGLYDYDIEAEMNWENTDNFGKSNIGVKCSLYEPYTNKLVIKDHIVCPTMPMDKRYLRSMYPIFETQVRGWGLGDDYNGNTTVSNVKWNENNPNEPKVFEVDYIRITQKKDKRFATVIDEFENLENFAKTSGIRKAKFDYPNVEGINYGRFEYGGQPLYETDMLLVDESGKDKEQSIVYRVKNLRGISLLAYFDPSIGLDKQTVNLNKATGFPYNSIEKYASNPKFDFKIQVKKNMSDSWIDMPFDARWDGNDRNDNDVFVAKNYEKIELPEKTYNYVKVIFPNVGENWNKILLSKVVLTRYEGTNYDNYKIEGE